MKSDNRTDSNKLYDYQKFQVRYKKLIKTRKGSFLRKALSSEKPKQVWDGVDSIINLPKNCIQQNISDLSNYFTIVALNLSRNESEPLNESEILQLMKRVPCTQRISHQLYHLQWSLQDYFEP